MYLTPLPFFRAASFLSPMAGGKLLYMSIVTARAGAAAWKRDALAKLRQTRALVKEFNGNLDKLCNSVKTLSRDVSRRAKQIGDQYDKSLDDADDDYAEDSDTMDALQGIPDSDEQADDVKLQAGETLEGLVTHLDELISTIQEIKVLPA